MEEEKVSGEGSTMYQRIPLSSLTGLDLDLFLYDLDHIEAKFTIFLLLQSVQTPTGHYSYTAALPTQRYTLRQVSHPHTLLTVDIGAGALEDVVPAAAVGGVQASRTVHEGPLGDGHGVGDNGRRDVLLRRDTRVVGLGQAGGVLTCR
jgi:hypothetical protein